MKIIKELRIRYFCSHKESVIKFHNGITIFLGESDQGKSVIPKALNFALNNELYIKNYITVGTDGPAEITVVFIDDSFVRRTKSKTKNRYEIGFIDESNTEIITETANSFGKEIPDKIKTFINSNNAKLDKDYTLNLNFSHQMDMPFLFNPKEDKDSIKAKLINTIADIQEFDIALQSSNRQIKNFNLDVNRYKTDIEKKVEELKQYSLVDKKKEILDKIKEKMDKIELNEKILKDISDTNKELVEIEEEIVKLSSIISQKEKIKEMESKLIVIELNILKKDKLNSLLNEFKSISKEISLIDAEITEYTNIVKSKKTIKLMEEKLNRTLQLSEKLSILSECYKELSKIDLDMQEIQFILSQKSIIQRQGEILSELIKNNDIQIKNNKLILDIQNINKEVISIDNEISKNNLIIDKKPSLVKMDNILNAIISKQEQNSELTNTKDSVDKLNSRIEDGNSFINNLKNEYLVLKSEYVEGLKKFGKCPLCMTKLTNEHLEEVLKEL